MNHNRPTWPVLLIIVALAAILPLSLAQARRVNVKTDANAVAWQDQAQTRAENATAFRAALMWWAIIALGVATGLALLVGVLFAWAMVRQMTSRSVAPTPYTPGRLPRYEPPVLEVGAQGPVMLRYRGGALTLDEQREAALTAGKER